MDESAVTAGEWLFYLLPLLIFAILGMTMAWLVYRAWAEQALMESLTKRLRREIVLIEQKRVFGTLVSHYLRTPLSLISSGIELMDKLNLNPQAVSRLKPLGQKLSLGLNSLLEQTLNEPPASEAVNVKQKTVSEAIGKARVASSRYLIGSLTGAFIAVTLAVYLLADLDPTDVGQNALIAEIAGALFISVLIFSGHRSRDNRLLIKQQLKRLILDLRQLDKNRSNLVIGSLNELKTPLNQLKGALPAVAGLKQAKPVIDGTGRFDSVLQKFVIMASLQTATMKKINQPFHLSELLDKIYARNDQKIKSKNLKIESKGKKDNVYQDKLLVEFALNSVIDNAIKYSPQGGEIEVKLKKKGDYVNVSVEDKGPGMAKDKLSLLFKPFSRTEDVVNRFDQEGLGLSLYLTKLIMIYLNGSTAIKTKAGKGTTVNLSLPVKAPQPKLQSYAQEK